MDTAAVSNIALFQEGFVNVARIDDTGKGFFNGGTQNFGADVTETFEVEGETADLCPPEWARRCSKAIADKKSRRPLDTLVAIC